MTNDLISRSALQKAFEKALFSNIDDLMTMGDLINNAPTVEAYTEEQVKELVELNKKLSESRPTGEWIEFAKFVAKEVCNDDFKDDSDCFAEIACRKLVKLGLVEVENNVYKLKGGAE